MSCALSPAHESETEDYFVCLLIVKYLLILFKLSHSIFTLDSIIADFGGFFKTFLEGSGPYHLEGLYSETALIYLL